MFPIEQNYCYHCFQTRRQENGPCPHCGYDPAADQNRWPSALRPGSILNGKYVLGRVLGQGGFGITYLALDHTLRLRVAVKEYFPQAMASRMPGTTLVTPLSPEMQGEFRYGGERFLDEARNLANMADVPGVVNVSCFFEENGTMYFVMEYVEGVNLQTYLRSHGGTISWQEALRLLTPVMQSLAEVHRRGMLHRDVTPDNIYVTPGGVKILDFGAARYVVGDHSRSLDVVLKGGYAPKEQYSRRGRQGPWTDVYSLAACFYAAVTGFVPPESLDRMEKDELRTFRDRGISVPEPFEKAILKGLAVRAENRFQSMDEFYAVLAPLLQPQGAPFQQPQQQPFTQQNFQQPQQQPFTQQNFQQPQQQPFTQQNFQQPQQQFYTHQNFQPSQQQFYPHQNFQQPPQPAGKQRSGGKKAVWIAVAAACFLLVLSGAILIPSLLRDRPTGGGSGNGGEEYQEDASGSNEGEVPAIFSGSEITYSSITVYAMFEEDASAVMGVLEGMGYQCEANVPDGDLAEFLQMELAVKSDPAVILSIFDEEDEQQAFSLRSSYQKMDPDNWLEDLYLVDFSLDFGTDFLLEFESETAGIHTAGKEYNNGDYYGYINASGLPHGRGYFSYDNGNTYYGGWEDGLFSGFGQLTFADGDEYVGEFANDCYEGQGTYTWADGEWYEGDFSNGVREGTGTMHYSDGDVYSGGYANDKFSGYGVYTWADGKRYEGYFGPNGREGQGTMYYTDGSTLSGTWADDEYIG